MNREGTERRDTDGIGRSSGPALSPRNGRHPPTRVPRPANVVPALLLVLVALALTARPATAADTREYAIKAAFLFHLTQFVEWPSESKPPPGEPFCIAVVQPSPFAGFLEEIVQGATVEERPIEVKYVGANNRQRTGACQILFVPHEAEAAARRMISAANGEPILLVGEDLTFLQRGGMIALVREGDRVTIVVNLQALRQANLHASSRLLRLARIIDDSPPAP